MYSNMVVVFNFIISHWSLTPQAFKEAVLVAALAKCVLAVLWWTTRMLVAKFPANATLSAASLAASTGIGASSVRLCRMSPVKRKRSCWTKPMIERRSAVESFCVR